MSIEQNLASLRLQQPSEAMSPSQNTNISTQTYTVESAAVPEGIESHHQPQLRSSPNISATAAYPRSSQPIRAPWEHQTIYSSAPSNNSSSFSYYLAPSHYHRARGTANVSSGGPVLVPMSRYVTGPNAIDIEPQNTRPHFRSKVVCVINCKHCGVEVCQRGMKAILLADMNVELYSTDFPPYSVQLVNDDYRTKNCACRIRDVACLGCGNVVGYHVTQPCESCMDACNNGHFWMFHCNEVTGTERTNPTNGGPLTWSQIPKVQQDASLIENIRSSMVQR